MQPRLTASIVVVPPQEHEGGPHRVMELLEIRPPILDAPHTTMPTMHNLRHNRSASVRYVAIV